MDPPDDLWYEQQQHEKLKLALIIIGWSLSQYVDPAVLYERKQLGLDEDDEDDTLIP